MHAINLEREEEEDNGERGKRDLLRAVVRRKKPSTI